MSGGSAGSFPAAQTCPNCRKPSALCVCAAIAPIATRAALLILQHPQEQDHVLGTADLAHRQFAWQIFDAKVLAMLRDEYRIRQVTKARAETLEALAAKLDGVDPAGCLATIAAYNAAVKTDVPFNPAIKDGRGTVGLAVPKSNWANLLDTPPFEAYAVTCGITFTFGGLRIDNRGNVLDAGEKPIPGLYAAGELVGGLFYFNYPGGSGLMAGAVFGRIAGTSAGRRAKAA